MWRWLGNGTRPTVGMGTACVLAVLLGCEPKASRVQPPQDRPASTKAEDRGPSTPRARIGEQERSSAEFSHSDLKPRIVRPQRARPYRGFGSSVAVAGDLLAVGIPTDDVPQPGCGSVSVFRREVDGNWHHFATLRGDDINSPVGFAHHVAIGRSFIAVTAYAESGHDFSGCVYVFEADSAGEYRQTAKLYPADPHNSQAFGSSLAADGDLLIVGAYQDNAQGRNAGAAYLFQRETHDRWVQQAKLVGSDTAAGHNFGEAVAIDGDYAAASARHHLAGQGRVYLFQRQENDRWTPYGALDAPVEQETTQFGKSLALHGKALLVGHWKSHQPVESAGQAHLFAPNNDGQWQRVQSIGSDKPIPREMLGFTVAINPRWLVAGTYAAEEVERGNVVYVFDRTKETAAPKLRLGATAAGGSEFFGACLALSGDTLVVGDPVFEQTASTENREADRGAIFVYQLP